MRQCFFGTLFHGTDHDAIICHAIDWQLIAGHAKSACLRCIRTEWLYSVLFTMLSYILRLLSGPPLRRSNFTLLAHIDLRWSVYAHLRMATDKTIE